MIADTTFVSHWLRERSGRTPRPAHVFLAAHRREVFRTSVITVGEVAVMFAHSWQAWSALDRWSILRLHPGIVDAAADVDREMRRLGQPLGENDTWIAGFARYYRHPIVSRDADFDRVPGVRRLAY
jgi:predicted nucleic acid-binding protein